MKFTTATLSLSILLILGLPLFAIAAAPAAINQALYYRNNHQLVTVEVTKADNTKVGINGLFMGIQLEQSTAPMNPFHS